MLNEILGEIPQTSVLLLGLYGSRLYGSSSQTSDYDWIAVIDTPSFKSDRHTGQHNLTVYGKEDFQQLIDENEIVVYEILNAPSENRLIDQKFFKTKLDLNKLRDAVSAKASNSWVKCKKKLEVEHDYYIGKKSLFHAFRILDYGCQIAETGQINNYLSCHQLWQEIVLNSHNDWAYYKDKYQKEYNALKSKFRLLAPTK